MQGQRVHNWYLLHDLSNLQNGWPYFDTLFIVFYL